ncbi:LOW QUALITY PROTEIN: uncharacterized protein LOC114481864 [Xyrichtys novacula]|uniref:LOW QUALITY PROTEIN: uncharacterized protein LOC114481864 n=1 Tax=Xyrichtys novacula TaxID=13765 RepID=A0AAV1GBG2_XYRNO|nr:LOW QUALITY PROTEIN: uncharacterized protein LOC114481864 [Xyrichtys novacula]
MECPYPCSSCEAPLEPDDGHDLCPRCLGVAYLRDALGDDACMNCTYMPYAVRAARLAEVEDEGELSSGQTRRSKRRAEASTQSRRSSSRAEATTDHAAPPSKKKKPDRNLTSKVDQLSAELAQMKALLMAQAHRPESPLEEAPTPPMPHLDREEDALSLAASATHFCEFEEDGESSTSRTSMGSRSSSYSSLAVTEDSSMRDLLRTALEQLNVAAPQQARSAPASTFFRRRPPPTSFTVPHSEDFLRELQASWIDSKAGSNESLRQDARCPRPQSRQTDDLLVRAYDSGARAGRIGNSLSHLMLALSASLHVDDAGPGGKADGEAGDSSNFCDAALEAFGHMSQELGRMMSYLVQARRQVWLSQSPLTEKTRRTLRALPVEPGTIFGPAAQEALERTIQAGQTRQQLAGLRPMPPPNRAPPSRGRGRSNAPRGSTPTPAYSSGQRRSQRPVQGQTRDPRVPDSLPPGPSRHFRSPDPGRPPPRPPRGRGPKY